MSKAKSTDDITRYTAIRWLNCFLHAPSSHDAMLAFLADLLVAVLPCISHSATNVRDAAIACNHRLLTMDLSKHLATVGIGPVLTSLSYELVSQQEPTRLEALKWVQVPPLCPRCCRRTRVACHALQPPWRSVSRGRSETAHWRVCRGRALRVLGDVPGWARGAAALLKAVHVCEGVGAIRGRSVTGVVVQVLLEHNKAEVLQQWHDIMPALLDALTATSDGVVNQVRMPLTPALRAAPSPGRCPKQARPALHEVLRPACASAVRSKNAPRQELPRCGRV